jgi:hypothetical protein
VDIKANAMATHVWIIKRRSFCFVQLTKPTN